MHIIMITMIGWLSIIHTGFLSIFLRERMGLAGPKVKQRIGNDPQNKQWSESNKGSLLLKNMGWKGKGLGVNEAGMTSAIKVVHKVDLEGIGAKGVRGDAWLDNSSAFDDILSRLNSAVTPAPATPASADGETKEAVEKKETVPAFGRMFHRTKFVKNKLVIGAVTQVSNYDAAQLNNILGRKTNGEDARAAEYQKPYLAPGEVEKVKEVPSDGTVTNTMSVNDYFAQKMVA
jgi:Pin2-interacting protein X1